MLTREKLDNFLTLKRVSYYNMLANLLIASNTIIVFFHDEGNKSYLFELFRFIFILSVIFWGLSIKYRQNKKIVFITSLLIILTVTFFIISFFQNHNFTNEYGCGSIGVMCSVNRFEEAVTAFCIFTILILFTTRYAVSNFSTVKILQQPDRNIKLSLYFVLLWLSYTAFCSFVIFAFIPISSYDLPTDWLLLFLFLPFLLFPIVPQYWLGFIFWLLFFGGNIQIAESTYHSLLEEENPSSM